MPSQVVDNFRWISLGVRHMSGGPTVTLCVKKLRRHADCRKLLNLGPPAHSFLGNRQLAKKTSNCWQRVGRWPSRQPVSDQPVQKPSVNSIRGRKSLKCFFWIVFDNLPSSNYRCLGYFKMVEERVSHGTEEQSLSSRKLRKYCGCTAPVEHDRREMARLRLVEHAATRSDCYPII